MKILKPLIYIGLVAFCGVSTLAWQAPVLAAVETRTVEVTGSGATFKLAVNRALLNAIAQVNGSVIASRTATALKSVSSAQDGQSSTISNRLFAEKIKEKTNGIVQSFLILEAGRDPKHPNVHVVSVEATIPIYEQSTQLQRYRLAVLPPRISHAKTMTFARDLQRGIENYITQSRKFAVLDRGFLAEQNAELDFLRQQKTPVRELTRLGNKVGADFIVTGDIVRARATEDVFTFRSNGKSIRTPVVSVRIDYRVIDPATGQVMVADILKTRRKNITLERAAAILSAHIGQKILNAIFPIAVIAVNGQSLTLNQGGKTVKPGQIFDVVLLGAPLIDPSTNESLGRNERIVGSARIETVQAKISTAALQTLSINTADLLTRDFILRPRADMATTSDSQKAAHKLSQEIDETIEKKEKTDANKW